MEKQLITIPVKGMVTDPEPASGYASNIDGFWYAIGKLRSQEGRKYLAGIPHVYNVTDGEFGNHISYYSTETGKSYAVARCGQYIWLGIIYTGTVISFDNDTHELEVTGYTDDFPLRGTLLLDGNWVIDYNGFSNGTFSNCDNIDSSVKYGAEVYCLDWRMLWGDTSATGYGYPARTANTEDALIQINDVLYFGGGGVPGRWSGFEYHEGLVTSGYGSANPTHVSGNFYSSLVNPGDTIYFRYYIDDVPQWDPTGYVVLSNNNTSLTLSGNAPDFTGKGYDGGNSVEYQIVRTCQMGVPYNTGLPISGSGVSKDSGGYIPPGIYHYYSRYIANTGYYGLLSEHPIVTFIESTPASLTTGTTATNDIKWTSKNYGADENVNLPGDTITVEIIESGNNTPLSVSVTDTTVDSITYHHITVNLATDSSGNSIVTASQVAAAVMLNTDAANVVTCEAIGLNAYLYTGTLGTNRIHWLAANGGTTGNNIVIELVKSGNNTPLSINVVGSTITVNLATDSSGNSISVVDEIINLVRNSESASDLVIVESSDTGVVQSYGSTHLSGGGLTTGYVDALSETSLTDNGDTKITFDKFLFGLSAKEPHLEKLELWRVPVVDGVEGVFTLAQVTYCPLGILPDTIVDDGTYEDPTGVTQSLEADHLYYNRPGADDIGSILYYWQGRLATKDSAYPGNWRMSSYQQFEYWPVSGTGTYGGYYPITNTSSDPIVDMIGEGGSYALTGRVGSDLLIGTKNSINRLSGYDWTDFKIDQISQTGIVGKTMQNNYGYTFMLTMDGPVRLPVGSLELQPIFQKLWPRGMKSELGLTESNLYELLSESKTFVYGEYYGLELYDKTLYLYHIPSDSWSVVNLDSDIKSFAFWGGPNDSGQITATDSNGLWQLFTTTGQETDSRSKSTTWYPNHPTLQPLGPTGIYSEWTTGAILPSNSDGFDRYAKLIKVTALVRSPAESQNLNLVVYVDGDTSNPQWVGDCLVAADSALTGKRVFATWYPYARGFEFQFKVSGIFNTAVEIESMEMNYTLQEVLK